MATKTTKGCPQGQVSNGKGGCKPVLPPKPSPKVSAETVEEKAERIAKAKEAAAAAEQKRVAGLSKKEFKQEKQGIKRNVKVADLKAGKEGKGGKVATAILGALSSAVGVAEGVKGLLKKEKKGGAINNKLNNKLKTIGNMKTTRTKMQMGGVKKYQKGGSTTKKKVDNSITGKMQRGLDYLLGSDKLRAAGTSLNNAVRPYADKTRTAMNSALRPSKSKTSTAKKMQMGGPVKRGTSMMAKGGIKKK